MRFLSFIDRVDTLFLLHVYMSVFMTLYFDQGDSAFL